MTAAPPLGVASRLVACQVLRCSGEARHLRNVGKPGGPRLDAVVCDGHQAVIEAGAGWYLEPDDRVIYMGEDLRARLRRGDDQAAGGYS